MSSGVLPATMNRLAVASPFRQFRDSSSPWTVSSLPPRQLRRCRTVRQEILRDAGGDPRRRGPDRIPRQMRIPGGGPDLAVPEQLGDHGQALAQRQRPRREGMPAVVNPDVLDPRALPHDPPRVVQGWSCVCPASGRGLPRDCPEPGAVPPAPYPPVATAARRAGPSCFRGASIRWPRGRCQSIAGTGSRSCGSRSALAAG